MGDNEEELRIYLRAEGETAKHFSRIKEHLGLKNDTEVIRSLINWYYREHEEDLQPKLKHFNLNPGGVLVHDRDLNSIVHVYFKPDRIICEHCGVNGCRHVEFALSLPEVQEILRKRMVKPELNASGGEKPPSPK